MTLRDEFRWDTGDVEFEQEKDHRRREYESNKRELLLVEDWDGVITLKKKFDDTEQRLEAGMTEIGLQREKDRRRREYEAKKEELLRSEDFEGAKILKQEFERALSVLQQESKVGFEDGASVNATLEKAEAELKREMDRRRLEYDAKKEELLRCGDFEGAKILKQEFERALSVLQQESKVGFEDGTSPRSTPGKAEAELQRDKECRRLAYDAKKEELLRREDYDGAKLLKQQFEKYRVGGRAR